MKFVSDNVIGAAPEILTALTEANHGTAASYGDDRWTERVKARLMVLFERDVGVILTTRGTAAYSLALATPSSTPAGAIFVHEAAHAQTDERGAPDFFTGGTKLLPVRAGSGKLTLNDVRGALGFCSEISPRAHRVRPQALSLAQLSEYGLVYGCAELRALCELTNDYGFSVHMDGTRFANALVAQVCTTAEATWQQGVDARTFFATTGGDVDRILETLSNASVIQ